MNNHEETSRARAMRLLALVRQWTEQTIEPVVIAELAAPCQLSRAETEAAWRYLRDHGLIDTFSVLYTARINAKGIDALDSETHNRSGDGALTAGPSTVRGFGRVDSSEALDRAREVSKELDRLHAFLPKLTDSEISAYSTKSLSIGTFLQSKGQTFSVLTEDMLANAFKEEIERRRKNADRLRVEAERRKLESTPREVSEVTEKKRSPWEFGSWIAGIVAALIGLATLIYEIRSKSSESDAPKKAPEAISQTQTSGTQIGQAGSVNIYNTTSANAAIPKSEEAKVVLAAFNLNDERGYFKETSPSTFEATNKYGRLAGCSSETKYRTSQSYRKRCGDVARLTPVFDVTLSVDGGGHVVLNGIAAEVTQVTRMVEGGEGATVPKATIPLSAKYVIDLPAQQEGRDNQGTVRVAAIPPLLLSDQQPARFQIAVRHHCVNECTAILTLTFGLSTNQSLSTQEIQFVFGRDVPDPCVNSREDLVDRCVADWDRKAQQEQLKREAEDKAEAAFNAKAADYLKAAGISYTHTDLWRLWQKGVKPEDVVAAINQARSPSETKK